MALNFKKNIVVGVSVNPEAGLEVAQIDYATQVVLKYGSKPLAYDNIHKDIADLDIFNETLMELFTELEISEGAEVVLNLPTAVFKVSDYPASNTEAEILGDIEDQMRELPLFKESEPCITASRMPNSTIQMSKIAYTVTHKNPLIEISRHLQSKGYSVNAIDTSVDSVLNALMYCERVDVTPGTTWVMLLVEGNCCRVISMVGKNYIDCVEERVSIGEVLGDTENYATIVQAVSPILKNMPAKNLYVISKTNIISAKALAEKLEYKGRIIHQEANIFNPAPFLKTAPNIDEEIAATISLDVIGAAINKNIQPELNAHFNFFNASLGDVYIDAQPLTIPLGATTIALTLENMIIASIIVIVIAALAILCAVVPLKQLISAKNNDIADVETKINNINTFLKENENISSEQFDEGDEIRIGLVHNKNVYTYYTIVGTEIPKKLWLTSLSLGEHTTIEGQADNLESIYAFYRNIKDYNPSSKIKLQKLGLASRANLTKLSEEESFDTDSIITSMNADYYEFRISDGPEVVIQKANKPQQQGQDNNNDNSSNGLPEGLESIE